MYPQLSLAESPSVSGVGELLSQALIRSNGQGLLLKLMGI
jgi:hypothetical protein